MKHTRMTICLAAVCLSVMMSGCGNAAPEAVSLPDSAVTRVATEPDRFAPHTEYTASLLTEYAEAVVCADVVKRIDPITSKDGDFWPIPIVQVRVREVLCGDVAANQTLYVVDTGYPTTREGGEPVEVTTWGEPCMMTGERVVLFLKGTSAEDSKIYQSLLGTDDTVYSIAADEIGKFFVDEEDLCYPSMHFSTHYQSGKAIILFDPMEPQPLADLTAAVRGKS